MYPFIAIVNHLDLSTNQSTASRSILPAFSSTIILLAPNTLNQSQFQIIHSKIFN